MEDLFKLPDAAARLITQDVRVQVMLLGLVLGWVLKAIARFPNKFIPHSVIVAEALAFLLLGNIADVDYSLRQPQAALFVRGACLGLATVVSHHTVISRLEMAVPGLREILQLGNGKAPVAAPRESAATSTDKAPVAAPRESAATSLSNMKSILSLLSLVSALSFSATAATNAPAPAPAPAETKSLLSARPKPGRAYIDSFLSLRTPNFSEGDYGYGIGVGYQVTKYWALEARASHQGLDVSGSAIQDLGGRLVARMPFDFLSPYTFLGASFDLERDAWHLTPGGGIEIGVNRKLKGLSIFAEGGLDADLKGHSGYLFSSGVRLRF